MLQVNSSSQAACGYFGITANEMPLNKRGVHEAH